VSNGLRKGLLDLINGGGIGAEGDKFQGGGLLSVLANAFATPYGSEDRAKEALAAGLLGKTRPQMRPNRPAPGSAPAPAYTQPISLSEMSRKLDVQDAPLTKMSQIPGGFNPASAAPVQVASLGDNAGFGSGLQGVDQSPNYFAPKDPYIAQISPTNLPNAPQQSALPDMTPSIGEFVEFLNRHYDPAFVRRVTLDSDRFEDAYRLFVNNGGKLTP